MVLAGSDVAAPDELTRFRDEARSLLAESGSSFSLPSSAVAFLFHQGYTFLYVEGGTGADGPVYQYVEGEKEPTRIAGSLAELMSNELRLLEQVHEQRGRRTRG